MSATLEMTLGPLLTEDQAREIYAQGEEAVIFALLTLAKQLAQQSATAAGSSHQTPATPSGMKPAYQKPPPRGRKKKPGRKQGHPGSRRPVPEYIHHRQTHRADRCPACHSRLTRCAETRTRYTEDIPEDLEAEVTEHTIHRDWCPKCKKKVELSVSDALPHAALGNRTLVLTAWLHFALGNTLSQIIEVFNFHLQMKLSEGGLVQMWHRLAEVLYPWYEEIGRQARQSAVLHGDETTLAGQRQDALAVVLRQPVAELLHDRPLAWQSGIAEVFHGDLRFASRAAGRPTAGIDRHPLEGFAFPTIGEAPASASRSRVHLLGPGWRPVR